MRHDLPPLRSPSCAPRADWRGPAACTTPATQSPILSSYALSSPRRRLRLAHSTTNVLGWSARTCSQAALSCGSNPGTLLAAYRTSCVPTGATDRDKRGQKRQHEVSLLPSGTPSGFSAQLPGCGVSTATQLTEAAAPGVVWCTCA